MVAAFRPLHRLLLSPGTFFDEHPPSETLPIAAGIVVLFTLCLVAAFLLIGSMLAGAIDATVTVDNPDRPPEPICERHADDPDSPFGGNCDEPETIERDAGAIVQEVMYDYLWIALVGPFVLWLVAGAVLYGAGRLAGGSLSGAGALALSGWAALPEFVRLAVGLLGLWVGLANVTITDFERAAATLEAAMMPIEPVLLGASLVTAGWQWYLLTAGLSRDADLSWRAAAVAVGIPLGIFTLASLA